VELLEGRHWRGVAVLYPRTHDHGNRVL